MSITTIRSGARPLYASEDPSVSELLSELYAIAYCDVDSGTVISAGDLLYLETDDVRPASDQFDQGTLSLNQQTFHGLYAGVALISSASGEVSKIPVATQGLFAVSVNSGSTSLVTGDLIGAVENGAGDTLLNQEITEVGSAAKSLGKYFHTLSNGDVVCSLVSTIFHGGVQVEA